MKQVGAVLNAVKDVLRTYNETKNCCGCSEDLCPPCWRELEFAIVKLEEAYAGGSPVISS